MKGVAITTISNAEIGGHRILSEAALKLGAALGCTV